MTDDQVERIAELVFQKILKKQEEWEKEFNRNVPVETDADDPTYIVTQLAVAEMLLKQYIETEDYILAGEIKKTINILEDKLKKITG